MTDARQPVPVELRADAPGSRRWVAVILTVVIFVAGGLAGAGFTAAYYRCRIPAQPQRSGSDRMANELKDSLGLSDPQLQKLKDLVLQRRQASWPRFEKEMLAFRQQVNAILTPTQREKWAVKFEEMMQKWRAILPATQPATASAPAPAGA